MNAIEDVIARVVAALQTAPGVVALVLGGSRAAGTYTDTSDIDIGIYSATQKHGLQRAIFLPADALLTGGRKAAP